MENSTVDFKFVKVPFDEVDGAGIEVSDADIKSYMNENKSEFEVTEETRVAQLAVFDVNATESDINVLKAQLEDVKTAFLQTEDDSLFVVTKGGSYTHIYGKKEQLPEVAREEIVLLEPGEAYGPFQEQNFLYVVKND